MTLISLPTRNSTEWAILSGHVSKIWSLGGPPLINSPVSQSASYPASQAGTEIDFFDVDFLRPSTTMMTTTVGAPSSSLQPATDRPTGAMSVSSVIPQRWVDARWSVGGLGAGHGELGKT